MTVLSLIAGSCAVTGRCAVVAYLSVSALAGCSWFSGPTKPPPTALTEIGTKSLLAPVWNLDSGRAGIGFQPAVINDSVFAAASDGRVTRAQAATGKLLWRTELERPLVTGVGSDGDNVVVAGRDGSLIALDSVGKQRWSVATGAEVNSVPLVSQGSVIVRTSDSRVSAFDLENGKRRWTFQRQAPSLILRQTVGIALDGATVFVGLPGGRLVALNAQNGSVRWEAAVSQPKGSNEIERIADVVATPMVNGRDVCAVSFQGRVGCFDAATGRGGWTRDLSSSVGLDLDPRLLVASDDKDHLHAFSRAGASVWRSDKLAWRGLSRPLTSQLAVIVGDRFGFVHALDRDDGAIIGRVATDGSAVLAGPVAAGSLAIVQTAGGSLYGIAAAK